MIDQRATTASGSHSETSSVDDRTPRFNEQVQRWLVSMIQSGGSFEAVSFARSMVEIVGDLIAAALGDGAHARSFRQVLA